MVLIDFSPSLFPLTYIEQGSLLSPPGELWFCFVPLSYFLLLLQNPLLKKTKQTVPTAYRTEHFLSSASNPLGILRFIETQKSGRKTLWNYPVLPTPPP